MNNLNIRNHNLRLGLAHNHQDIPDHMLFPWHLQDLPLNIRSLTETRACTLSKRLLPYAYYNHPDNYLVLCLK